ncbi:MAG: serine/threonine-protein kinase [Planctomycetota bacterium]
MSCPASHELELFRMGELGGDDPRVVEAHVADCRSCGDALAALTAADQALFDDLQRAARRRRGDAVQAPSLNESLPPELVGYTHTRVIHRGPRGGVHLATDPDGRNVAIKILLGGSWTSARDHQRFAREIALAQCLDDPRIVPIEGSGTSSEGAAYFVMPYVDGRELDAHAREVAPDLAERVRLGVEICAAVAHAHARGVVHRDLKPANILVDRGGQPRILDFGLAKLEAETGDGMASGSVTWSGQFVGTPAYAAPEQLTGGAHRVTARSDVYALGVVLYQLLADAMPYDVNGTLADLAHRVARDEPRELGKHVPAALRVVVLRALEKEPARRYADAGALGAALGGWSDPGRAGSGAPWRYLAGRYLRRHRRALLAQAAVSAVILAIAVGWLAMHFRVEGHRRAAGEIQEVLGELIRAAGPERMGGDVALVDVVDQVARRLQGRLEHAPEAHAAVQSAIGDTYFRLLRFDAAAEHLRLAQRRDQAVRSAPTAVQARTRQQLALALSQLGDPAAIEHARAAVDLWREVAGADSPQYAAGRRALGFTLLHAVTPQLEAARPHLEFALAAFEDAGRSEREAARSAQRLAEWHWAAADGAAAAPFFAAATETFERAAHRRSAWAVDCFRQHARFLQTLGEFRRAEVLLQRSIELTAEVLGEHLVPEVLWQSAWLNLRKGDDAEAERWALRALQRELLSWARRRPDEAAHLEALAAAMVTGLHTDAGRAAALAGFAELRRYRGLGDYEVSRRLSTLARLADRRGQPGFAEAAWRAALEFECRAFGRDCPVRLDALERLGELLCAQGRGPEAVAPLQDALAQRRRLGTLDEPGGVAVQALYGRCCDAAGGERTK